MDRPRVTIRSLVAIAGLCMLVGTTACSSSESGTASTPTAPSPPELVGRWEGTYQFPTVDGDLVTSPLLVVIERQEGRALWGYEEFEDGGQVIRIPLTGSLSDDQSRLGLGATGLIVDGELTGPDDMRLRFFKVTDPATSFEAEVQRRD